MKYDNLGIAILFAFAFISTFVYSQPSVKIPEFKKCIQVFEQNDRTWEAAIADLNGDNFLDLVIANLGSETAVFRYVRTGDLNNDGYVDIIITNREKPAEVWMDTGKGKFINSGIKLGEGGLWNNSISKDIDNDGDNDIFITKVYDGIHGLWLNQLSKKKRK